MWQEEEEQDRIFHKTGALLEPFLEGIDLLRHSFSTDLNQKINK